MRELDALRGAAVLGVVLYHGITVDWSGHVQTTAAHMLAGVGHVGKLGVQLFFVLSGFLITGILIDQREHPRYYRRFYVRRALRILPVYVVTLLIIGVLHIAPWSFVALSGLFLPNFAITLGLPLSYGVLWSLGVEEHFYLVWPTLVRRVTPRTLAVGAGALAIGSVALRAAATAAGVPAETGFYPTWFNLDGLALGALVAVGVRATACGTRRGAARLSAVLITVGALLVAALVACAGFSRTSVLGSAFAVFAPCLMFAGLLIGTVAICSAPDHREQPAPWVRPLLFLGDISYGLYLFHEIAFRAVDSVLPRLHSPTVAATVPTMLLRFGLALALAIVVCTVSRRTLEAYFLSFKVRFGA